MEGVDRTGGTAADEARVREAAETRRTAKAAEASGPARPSTAPSPASAATEGVPAVAVRAAQEAGDADKVKLYAELLYNQALLVEGLPIEDPVAYANAVTKLMA